ncbi:MAG: hypothetical protein FWJ73_06505 [Limnochordales bacterium]
MRVLLNGLLPKYVLSDHRLPRTSKLLYLAMRSGRKGTTKEYAERLGIPYATVRRAMVELRERDWVYPFRIPKQRSLVYVPFMPLEVERLVAAELERWFDAVSSRGEQLLKAFLDLLVDDDHFLDNARPSWAAAGPGDAPPEFDRIYPHWRVAIDFQGRQHYEEATFPDGKSDLKRQQSLDARKALACLRQQYTLVEIADVELSYETIVAKLRGLLPMIPPLTHRPLFRTLQALCREHAQQAAERRTAG